MPATVHDIARRAGVSIATVSRVLNGNNHPVTPATRQLVLDAASALGYHPNYLARSLRTEHTATVGVITDDITSPFSPLIVRGIQDNLKVRGYHCIVINADWDPDLEREAIRDLISRAMDGVIFAESWHRAANTELDLVAKPYVFVHRQFAASYPYSVAPDEVYGARLAVRHLLGLGHERIAYINGPEHYYASSDRLAGYKAELAAAGIEMEPQLVERGDWTSESGLVACRELLRRKIEFSALFAGNDLMAVGAIYALNEAGLLVPEDVAVVGYDDRPIAAIFRPSITTVTLPCYEMGQAAATMLLERMAGLDNIDAEVQIRGRLILRDTCGGFKSSTALREETSVEKEVLGDT